MRRIYFMRPVGMDGPIKIGFSIAPQKRLAALNLCSPLPLELVATAEGGCEMERALHIKFASSRLHGEWFGISDALSDFIDDIRRNGRIVNMPEILPRRRMARSQSERQALLAAGMTKRQITLLASGKFTPSLDVAVRAYRLTGNAYGPLSALTKRDIKIIDLEFEA